MDIPLSTRSFRKQPPLWESASSRPNVPYSRSLQSGVLLLCSSEWLWEFRSIVQSPQRIVPSHKFPNAFNLSKCEPDCIGDALFKRKCDQISHSFSNLFSKWQRYRNRFTFSHSKCNRFWFDESFTFSFRESEFFCKSISDGFSNLFSKWQRQCYRNRFTFSKRYQFDKCFASSFRKSEFY